jgi:hypothetical protein
VVTRIGEVNRREVPRGDAGNWGKNVVDVYGRLHWRSWEIRAVEAGNLKVEFGELLRWDLDELMVEF